MVRRRLALLGEHPGWLWPVLRTTLAAGAAALLFTLILSALVIHSLPDDPPRDAPAAPPERLASPEARWLRSMTGAWAAANEPRPGHQR